MKLYQLILLSVVFGVPLGDWVHTKREKWAKWKQEAWGVEK